MSVPGRGGSFPESLNWRTERVVGKHCCHRDPGKIEADPNAIVGEEYCGHSSIYV